jgi:hypothetical protein
MYTSFLKINCVRYSLYFTGVQEKTWPYQHLEGSTYSEVQGTVGHKTADKNNLDLLYLVYQIWDTVQYRIRYRVVINLSRKVHWQYQQLCLMQSLYICYVWLLIQLPIESSVNASNTTKEISVRSKEGNVENINLKLAQHWISNLNYNTSHSENNVYPFKTYSLWPNMQ